MMECQCDFMDYIDDELAALLGEEFPGNESSPGSDSSSSSTLISIPQSCSAAATATATTLCTEPPQVSLKPPVERRRTNNFSNLGVANILDRASSTPVILDFGNSNSVGSCGELWPVNPDELAVNVSEVFRNNEGSRASKRRRIRPPSQTYDHIMAERKRREQLSQLFIALSTLVPGLKKMDKSSVLGETINYLKQLQERVKILEEKAAKQTMESAVLVKKSQIVDGDDGGSSDDKSWSSDAESLPEIQARVCGKSVLLKILCEKRKGVLVEILAEVEKLNLAVVSTSVTPFGSLTIDITVIAEMDEEINLAATDVVKTLRSALQAAEN